MTAPIRRERRRAERHRLILDVAREIAEADGWDAVTTRRLAERIDYSQPVLYSHFAGKDEIVDAVALEGFGELAALLSDAVGGTPGDGRTTLTALVRSYLRFGAEHPAVYAAMFTLHTGLRFAVNDAPGPLHTGFGVLADTLAAATGPERLDTRAELLWCALHGLVSLGAGHRLRPDHTDDRIDLLVAATLAAGRSGHT